MPTVRGIVFCLFLVSGARLAAAGELSGRITDRASREPVAGVLVHVSGADGFEKVLTTDSAGRYSVELPAGTYHVVITYGRSLARARISMAADSHLTLDDQVDSVLGEVIVINQRRPAAKRPAVLPVPKNHSRIAAPPYSDTAILSDAWTRAWLLLDVSKTGEVVRFKFLKRPGYDLETIATKEAFRLRFEPARDTKGRRISSLVVWLIEWPSHGWLIDLVGIATRMPPPVGVPPRSMAAYVPCAGSGPLKLDSVHPTYRDCSEPDLSRAGRERWIVANR